MPGLDLWNHASEWSEGVPPEIHPADVGVLTFLLNEVKHKDMVVVEVGSWVGNGSTRVIVETIRDVKGTLYCVDTWAGSDNVSHHRQYRARFNSMFMLFSENVRQYQGRDIVKPLAMPSLEASKLFPDKSVDLVFIDANHGYSHVKQDLLAWLPKVRSGGFLCGHDCDASYQDLDANLKAAIEPHCEEDCFENDTLAGPTAFHPGVVKAVHEIFGNKADLWFKVVPTTVWSYKKHRNVFDRLCTFLMKKMSLPRRGVPVGRAPALAQTPWPVDSAEGTAVHAVSGSTGATHG